MAHCQLQQLLLKCLNQARGNIQNLYIESMLDMQYTKQLSNDSVSVMALPMVVGSPLTTLKGFTEAFKSSHRWYTKLVHRKHTRYSQHQTTVQWFHNCYGIACVVQVAHWQLWQYSPKYLNQGTGDIQNLYIEGMTDMHYTKPLYNDSVTVMAFPMVCR